MGPAGSPPPEVLNSADDDDVDDMRSVEAVESRRVLCKENVGKLLDVDVAKICGAIILLNEDN